MSSSNFSYLAIMIERVARTNELEIGDTIDLLMVAKILKDHGISDIGDLKRALSDDTN